MLCVTCGDILFIDLLVGVLCLCANVKCACVLELFCCEVKLWGRGFLVHVGGEVCIISTYV